MPFSLTQEELERKHAERQQAAGVLLTVSNIFRQLEQSWMVGDTAKYDQLLAMLPALRTEGQALGLFAGRSRGGRRRER